MGYLMIDDLTKNKIDLLLKDLQLDENKINRLTLNKIAINNCALYLVEYARLVDYQKKQLLKITNHDDFNIPGLEVSTILIVARQPLIHAAIASYGAIFKFSKAGEKVDDSIYCSQFLKNIIELLNLKELHKKILDYRDQLVAHMDGKRFHFEGNNVSSRDPQI